MKCRVNEIMYLMHLSECRHALRYTFIQRLEGIGRRRGDLCVSDSVERAEFFSAEQRESSRV